MALKDVNFEQQYILAEAGQHDLRDSVGGMPDGMRELRKIGL